MFGVYLELGFRHISDFAAYDHMLFLLALCAVYTLAEWKNVLVLVTAFTIGHSITLGLAALEYIFAPVEIIEFLIPLTILITAISQMLVPVKPVRKFQYSYLMACIFGLIHGLGFSNFFKSLLGMEERIVKPLFAFNLGVELGQILVVIVILLISTLAIKVVGIKRRYWGFSLSAIAGVISIFLMAKTWPF